MFEASLHIPSAKSIDYESVEEICGYQLLLCKMFEMAGGLEIPRVSSRETIAIKSEGIVWLHKVKGIIESLLNSPVISGKSDSGIVLGDIPNILSSYDFFYRICHGSPCFDFIKNIRLKAANRWLKGDKCISEAQVAIMLCKEISRDIRKIEQRYIDFSGSVMASWIMDLKIIGMLRGMTFEDTYRVLEYLLRDDLFAFSVNKDEKFKWIKTYTLSDSEIENLDVDSLWAYMGFAQAASFQYGKSRTDNEELYTRLLSKILVHPDSNRFIRETISLELARYQTA